MNTLVDLFKTFQGRGKKRAIVYRTGVRRFVFSYGFLYEYSLKTVQWLSDQGVQKGDRVVVWAPNSPWWQVAFWGSIARGAIVVPVDFMSGRERAEKIAELTEAKLVIQSQYKLDKITTSLSLRGFAKQSPSHVHNNEIAALPSVARNDSVLIENLEYVLQSIQPAQDVADTKPEDIAELIYTSGTTGDPKGVILTHKNVISNLIQINNHIPVVREDWNFFSLLPLSHVFEQIAGLLTPLCNGASVVYLRTLKPSAIMEAFEEEDIYALPIVPRLLQALKSSIEQELQVKHLYGIFEWLLRHTSPFSPSYLKRGLGGVTSNDLEKRKKWFFPIHKKFGKHFKLFISGAAALDAPTAEFWAGMGFRVLEGYGITECSPVLSANTFEKQIIGSVGKPLEGVEIKIVSEGSPSTSSGTNIFPERSPDLIGTKSKDFLIGEILAKGPNVFPGYYQNEEATKKAFTDDGWFKTGDMGYFDAEGNLYIKGRSKEMIVTGAGINVYPDDIEPVLSKITGVKEACVIGVDKGAGEEVHAVLILDGSPSINSGTTISPERSKAESKDYHNEVAKHIVELANAKLDSLQQITSFSLWHEHEFPKTTTMKVQKFKVKQAIESQQLSNETIGQSTDRLISIISRVVNKPITEIQEHSILVTDLGLTSIARLELVNFLEQEFRLDLEDSAITQNTSVADVRKMIEKREKHHARVKSRMWVHSSFGRSIQYLIDNLLNWHMFRYFVKLKVEGLENVNAVKGPVIFIGNHVSYLDGPCVYASLSAKWRYFLASGSWEGLFFKPNQTFVQRLLGRLYFEFMTLSSGAFLMTQDGGGFRQALAFMGKLIDRGVNILVFPEGERSWDGKLLPFQLGLGLIVKELKVPVVPFKITGVYALWPRRASFPKRGPAIIRYGKSIIFGAETPSEIVAISRKAIQDL